MNLGIIVMLFVVLVLIAVGILIFFVKVMFSEKNEAEDLPQHISFNPAYNENHVVWLEDHVDIGKERIVVWAYPRDINYKRREKEKKKKNELVPLIYRKELYISFSVHDLSGHRSISFGFPEDINLLPGKLQEHPFGQSIMNFIQNKVVDMDKAKQLEKRIRGTEATADAMSDFKLAEDYVERVTELNKDLRDSNEPPKQDKK